MRIYDKVRTPLSTEFESLRGRNSVKLRNLVQLIKPVALSLFFLYAMANIPGAQAGGKEYGDCLAQCAEANKENGIVLLLCPVICLPFLFG